MILVILAVKEERKKKGKEKKKVKNRYFFNFYILENDLPSSPVNNNEGNKNYNSAGSPTKPNASLGA